MRKRRGRIRGAFDGDREGDLAVADRAGAGAWLCRAAPMANLDGVCPVQDVDDGVDDRVGQIGEQLE